LPYRFGFGANRNESSPSTFDFCGMPQIADKIEAARFLQGSERDLRAQKCPPVRAGGGGGGGE